MFTHLTHLGLLAISGQDAKKFLQGQLTCNLDEIVDDQHRLGAHCTPQGRIISLFRIFSFHDQYYLLMPIELIPTAHAALKKYAVFFKTTLKDASKELQVLGYSGTEINFNNDTKILKLSDDRYIILTDVKNDEAENSIEPWRQQDIEAAIPAIYPETSEKFLPHEINFHKLNGISFDKGCYTGQEIIARMQYRGKLKSHMYLVSVTTDIPPQRGQDIFNETNVSGTLVDYVNLGYNNYKLLVIVSEADTSITLYIDAERKNKLTFLALPYSL